MSREQQPKGFIIMSHKKQRGSTTVLVVVGLSALIAMGGLALDTSHVFLNTARLQSALDAAALAGAKSLDQSTSTILATSTANSVFTANLTNYPELQTAVGNGLTLTTQFSSTLNPFTPGTNPAAFIRTSVNGFQTTMSVVSVLGIPSISVKGSAVAGPSASLSTTRNVAPLVVCANPAAAGPYYGYTADQVIGLKQLSSTNSNTGCGSYGTLDTSTNPTNTDLPHCLAGDFKGSANVGDTVTTHTGTATTSICGGLNTRFGQYSGISGPTTSYPPDTINSSNHRTSLSTDSNGHVCDGNNHNQVVTTASQLGFNHTSYRGLNKNANYDTPPTTPQTASFTRREVTVALADCTGTAHGGSSSTVLGFACLFLLQPVNSSDADATIYGQVLSNCNIQGRPSPTSASTGPHTIELFKSAGSPDS
jgi:Flp pilus assembly protein TadG